MNPTFICKGCLTTQALAPNVVYPTPTGALVDCPDCGCGTCWQVPVEDRAELRGLAWLAFMDVLVDARRELEVPWAWIDEWAVNGGKG